MIGRAKTRGSRLLPKCKKAYKVLETDGNYYCYGFIDRMNDELIDVCKECKANVNNIEELYTKAGGENEN